MIFGREFKYLRTAVLLVSAIGTVGMRVAQLLLLDAVTGAGAAPNIFFFEFNVYYVQTFVQFPGNCYVVFHNRCFSE